MIAALRRWIARLANALRPGRAEAGLTREIAAHLTLLEDEYQRRGMNPAAARAAARRAFGGVEQTKDRQRDARSFVWLNDVRWDVRYALRLLARNPVFSATAALSLAIGIGANTTIFTIANALLFGTPTGVVEPRRVVEIGATGALNRGGPGDGGGFSQVAYLNYLDVRSRVTTLEGVYAYQPVAQPMSLETAMGAEPINGGYVSANYFALLGARPAIGRLFDERDERGGDNAIVVVSHRFWQRRFHADPALAGQAITINGGPFTVVGVAPEGFHGTSILLTDVWLPIEMGPAPLLASREMGWPLVGGRLKAGVTVARAAAEVDAIGRALEREFPVENRGKSFRLLPATPVPGNILPVAGFLTLLMGIVSLVLVIACANVAGVLLARATARKREIAVRLAMGAGRARLVRQMLTETTLLFAAGGAGGLVLARGMTTLLVSVLPSTLPLPVDMSLPLDRHVVVFTGALSLVAALVSGLVPALHASRSDVVTALKDEAQGPSDRLRLRQAFVVAQVAVSILLVVSAALFVRALRKGGAVDLGFDPRGVDLAALDLSLAGYSGATSKAFVADLAERVRQLPGVEHAAIASTGDPIGDGRRRALLTVPGSPAADGRPSFDADWNAVDSGYFATMKIPLLAGRDFNMADRGETPAVAILSEAAAARFFPDRSREQIIGSPIVLQPGQTRDIAGRNRGRVDRLRGDPAWQMTVVGIARDIRYFGPRADGSTLFVYVPLQQQPFGARVTIVARTTQGQRIAGDLRTLIASMNPGLPIVTSQTLEERTALSVIPQRVAASVSGVLGLVGLLLAAMGIYGVMAHTVVQRTREFGIRLALGASRSDVLRMVLRRGLALAAVGTAIGLLLAVGMGRLLASFLLGASPMDPLAFAAAALLFTLVGLAACLVPACRAVRIDPIEALRYE